MRRLGSLSSGAAGLAAALLSTGTCSVQCRQVRGISVVERVKRYFTVSPRQQALMQETPYSSRKAEELRKSRIMGLDNAIRSNGCKHFDKSKEEYTLDPAFVAPFALFAFVVFVSIAWTSVTRNRASREETIKAFEDRYGKASGYVGEGSAQRAEDAPPAGVPPTSQPPSSSE